MVWSEGKFSAVCFGCLVHSWLPQTEGMFYSWLWLSKVFETSIGCKKHLFSWIRPWPAHRWWNGHWWNCLPHCQSCWDLEAAAEAGLSDWDIPLHLGCELSVGKSLEGRKAGLFCQVGTEILEKLLPFSDLITVNYDNFAWKWLMRGSMWYGHVIIWKKKGWHFLVC